MLPNRKLPPVLILSLAAACGESPDTPEPVVTVEAEAPVEDEAEPFVRKAWLESESFVHAFGDVYPQSLHRVSFPAVAAGTEPLVIEELKHSCGCTSGELFVLGEDDARSPVEFGVAYPIGTRFELDATLNTLGRSGPQEQKVSVMLVDGTLDIFVMEADIKPFLIAEPANLVFEKVDPFEGVESSFQLRAANGERFTPTIWRKILGENLDMQLVPEELDDSGRSALWTGKVRILPGRGGETVRSKVILNADVPNLEAAPNPDGTPALQRLEFQVVAQVDPILRAWPERFNLGRIGPETELRNRTVLRCIDTDFDLSKAEVRLLDARGEGDFPHPESVQVEVVERESQSELELVLVTRALPGAGGFAGRISVMANHPLQKEIQITFKGTAVR